VTCDMPVVMSSFGIKPLSEGWLAALDEMRRPDWREVYAQTTQDVATRRGRNLDVIVKESGLEGSIEE
jgi:hypothetical protein